MNILLIYPAGKTSFVTPPLGLMQLAASLKEAGRQPEILDLLLDKFDENLLFQKAEKAELVGISVVTPFIDSAINLADLIKKKFPEKIIVFGGPHPTLLSKETLQNCQSVDFIVKGEGEKRINLLIDYLEGKKMKEDLEGIAFREGEEIIDLPPKEYIKDLNELPLPARETVSIEKYSKFLSSRWKPTTTVLTSRGCPFQCIYCSKPVFGRLFRARSPENILKEIELLKEKYRIKEIIFYDDSFTLNRQRIVRLCRLLIEKNLNIKWKCETRVNLVDEELLQLMKRAGCYLIGYGIESGNQKILNVLKKGITLEQVEWAVKATKEAGIEILGYFMLGIPGETEKEIKETINFALKLDLDYAQFAVATAFPGTELYQIARAQGKLPQDWSQSFYALGGDIKVTSLCDISSEALKNYLKKAYFSFYFRPKFIFNKIKKIRYFSELMYYLRSFKNLLKI